MRTLLRIFIPIILIIWLAYRFHRNIIRRILHLSPVSNRVKVRRNLPVLMEDGVNLMADHYSPRQPGSYPTVLIRSPYGRYTRQSAFGMSLVFFAHRFAERGYNVVVQDVRGRFDSGGEFIPFEHEKADGIATVNWITKQPWFNGKLGMWGGSYLGIAQWAIAVESPAITAIVPSITGSSLRDVVFPDDALDLGLMVRWLTILALLQEYYDRPLVSSSRMLQQAEALITPAVNHLPVREIEAQIVGETHTYFLDWLSREAANDEFWEKLRQENDITKVTAPAHLIGGWYDFFLRPLLLDYERLQQAGRQPYLTIGPWHHFSEIVSLEDLHQGMKWFDAHLKGDMSNLREKPVRLYVMGAEEWREFDTWPPASNPTRFYLHTGGILKTETPANDHGITCFHYDPNNPTPAVGGTQFGFGGGKRDNRKLEARDDVITFSTTPLVEALEVIGPVTASLYVQSTNVYTDFFARLCDVHPDGQSLNVCDGLFRIAPGKGQSCEDGTLQIQINMWATAYHFQPGHRLRLIIAGGAHPRWNRNPGTGEPLADAITLKPADQTVFHDEQHPSAVILPIHGTNTYNTTAS